MQRGVIIDLAEFSCVLRLIFGVAAEEDRGCGGGIRQSNGTVIPSVAELHILIYCQNDAVHIAGFKEACACVIIITVLVAELLLQLFQRELAFERILAVAVADGNQRGIAVCPFVLPDVLACQRIDAIDLVGEIVQPSADFAVCINRSNYGLACVYTVKHPIPCTVFFRLQVTVTEVGEITVIVGKCCFVIGIRQIAELNFGFVIRLARACTERLRVIPYLGFPQVFAVDIPLCLILVIVRLFPEIRHDGNIALGSFVIEHIVKIVFSLSVGRTDIFLLLVICEQLLGGALTAVIDGKADGTGGADLRIVVRIDLQIGFIAQLVIAAEQSVMIQTVISGFVLGVFVHQNQCTVAVAVNDLDSAVLDEL